MNSNGKEGKMNATYEIRVNLSDGYEIARLDACSIDEAISRASRIWSEPESVQILCIIDNNPQKCLAW